MIIQIAAGGGLPQGAMDDSLGTTDTCLYSDRFFRAIAGAGAAFHARIAVYQSGKTIVYCQDTVWTDHNTHTAPGASVIEETKCGHVGEVFHTVPPEMRIALAH